MSFITPPICVAVYVACAIANSAPLKTAFAGLRLGIAGYLFPFIMVYYPEILLIKGTLVRQVVGLFLSILFVSGVAVIFSGATFRWVIRALALSTVIITVFFLYLLR